MAGTVILNSAMLPVLTQSGVLAAETNADEETQPQEWSAQSVLDAIKTTAPSISEDGSHIVLPASPSEDYAVELYGSSNEAVIAMDGSITDPIETMTVTVMYKVVSKTDPEDSAVDQVAEASIEIAGLYEKSALDQPRPLTMPTIQEWKGNTGTLMLSAAPAIVCSEGVSEQASATIRKYFEQAAHLTLSESDENQTRISMELDSSLAGMPEGFYTVEIGSDIRVKAADDQGLVYGAATLCQMLRQSASGHELPQGQIRDYPAYEVRSIMIDVARFYMPIEYLDEIIDYMAFFKMNEFHCHINDNGGEQKAAFRVESKLYPKINSGLDPNEVYSQEDYRNFQKRAASKGVKVITEIDSPAHSAFVALHDASLMKDSSHINVSNPDAVEFMKSLFDEFLDGDDPVFQGDEFNIGTDEYPKAESEAVRAYINALIEHVSSKGLHTRMWGSLGDAGFKGETPVSNDATALFWNNAWASFDQMLDAGYSCITTPNFMYVVPGDPVNGHNDFLNMEQSYNTWNTNHLSGCWLWGSLNKSYIIGQSNPLLRGANGACWHDIKCGMSPEDSFARIQNLIGLFSEKTWLGNPREGQDGKEFAARWDALKDQAANSPARRVDSQGNLVASFDFESLQDGTFGDGSGNGYHASADGITLQTANGSKAAVLDGTGRIALPFERLGFPYNVSMDLYIDPENPENAVLFDGPDGKLVLNYNGTGCIGYSRRGYNFVIDCSLPVGTWINIKLSCDTEGLSLYLNNVYAGTGQYDGTPASYQKSSTINLQTASIGSGVKGLIDNLQIYSSALTQTEMSGLDSISYGNVALNKPSECSGIYGNGSYAHIQQKFLNDGEPTTRVQFAAAQDAWFIIDLEEEQCIDRMSLKWHNAPEKYQILISSDKENWTKVYDPLDCKGGPGKTDEIQFDHIVKARYVKYQQVRMFKASNNVWYSGSIYEMEVYGFPAEKLDFISECRTKLQQTAVTEENQAFITRFDSLLTLAQTLLENCTVQEAGILQVRLADLLDALENGTWDQGASPDDAKLRALISAREESRAYLSGSYNQYSIAYKAALHTLFGVHSSSDAMENARIQLENARNALEAKSSMSVSSNKKARSGSALSNILNGNQDSFVRLEGNQTAGDYIQIEMRDAVDLDSLKIVSDPAGTETPVKAVVEISADGLSWDKIGEIAGENEAEFEILPQSVSWIRVVLSEPASKPWKMTQILINQGAIADTTRLEELVSNPVTFDSYTDSTWQAYLDALANGQSVLDKERKNQPEVEEAVSRIETAIAGLLVIGDLESLSSSIESADALREGDWTPYSLEKLNAAIEAARAVRSKNTDASEAEVNKAVEGLEHAISALRADAAGTDSRALEEKLDAVINLRTTTSNAAAAYEKAHAEAEDLMNNASRSQKQIDLALQKLNRISETLPERALINAALNKPVTASGVYGNGVHAHLVLEHVNDGDLKTRTQFNQADESWMIIDLEKPMKIDRIKASWFNAPAQYEMQISLDGETWTTVASPSVKEGGPKAVDDMDLGSFMEARYVKYQQRKMFQSASNGIWYSGSPYEIEVFTEDQSLYTLELSYWIETGRAAEAASYTVQDWQNLQQILDEAQTVLDSAESQEAIDAACSALEEAVLHVKAASKSLLQMAVSYAEQIEAANGLEGVNARVAAYFAGSLDQAKAVLADAQAGQSEVNEAWRALVQAIQMLEFRSDFSELDLLIARAESLDLSQYEETGHAAFQAALEQARTVRQDPNALTDQSIAKAAADLQAAIDALQPIAPEEIDTSLLELLLSAAGEIDKADYTSIGMDEFDAALTEAQSILANPESQTQVDASTSRLHSAWLNLRRKPNEEDLKALQAFVNEVETLDSSLYSAETLNRIQKLGREVQAVLNLSEPTDQDVKGALACMMEAQTLISRPDGAEALSAAAGQKAGAASSQASSVKTAVNSRTTFFASVTALMGTALTALRRRRRK